MDFIRRLSGAHLLLLLSLSVLCSSSKAQEEQAATVGDFGSNNQQSAESIDNRTTTTVTQEGAVVNTAVAPSSPAYNQDVCVFSGGAGVQTQMFGLAIGNPIRDNNCELLKLSKQLQALGLKVGAVSVMCQDHRVWWALYESGTPCPTNQGLIGQDAYTFYKNRPDRVPDKPVIYREKPDRAAKSHSRNRFPNRK